MIGNNEKECCSCPGSRLIAAVKRFAVKYIPLFRKRKERAAVGELLGKLQGVAEAPAKAKAKEMPVRKSTEPRNS